MKDCIILKGENKYFVTITWHERYNYNFKTIDFLFIACHALLSEGYLLNVSIYYYFEIKA